MKYKLSLLTAVICSLHLSACGGGGKSGSTVQDDQIAAQLDVMGKRVPITVQLIDAATGQPVRSTVTLSADDSISGQNVYEDASIGSAIRHGTATVYLKESATKSASANTPVSFRLTASSDDYFSSGITISYTGAAPAVQKIYLISKTAPPQGAAVQQQNNLTASAGVLSGAIQLTATTADPASQGASGSFSLPAGSQLKDAQGKVLEGKLRVSVGYFSPVMPDIEKFFPGGLNQAAVLMNNGSGQTEIAGKFVTAGLLAVDIVDEKGRKAHLLSKQGSMTIQTPFGVINPETGAPVRAGETIPVWSHNEQTGLWQQETIGQFVQNANGSYSVSYQVDHLSIWNLDWIIPEVQPAICYNTRVRFENNFYQTEPLTLETRVDGQVAQRAMVTGPDSFIYSTGTFISSNVEYQVKDASGKTVGQASRAAGKCADTVNIKMTQEFLDQNPPAEYCPNDVQIHFPQPFHYDDGHLYVYESSNRFQAALIENESRVLNQIPKNRAVTLNVYAGGLAPQNKVASVQKPAGSCSDVTVQLDEQFITAYPPLEYCPDSFQIKPSTPFFAGDYWITSTITAFKATQSNLSVFNYYQWDKTAEKIVTSPLTVTGIPKNRKLDLNFIGRVKSKPLNSCADVTLDTSGLAGSGRTVTILPKLKINQFLSYKDMNTLVSNMGLSSTAKTELLQYTHPDGVSSPVFHLNVESYQYILNKWLNNQKNNLLRQLQLLTLTPANASLLITHSYMADSNDGENYPIYGDIGTVVSDNGQVKVELPDRALETTLFLGGFYGNKWHEVSRTINIPAGSKQVTVEFEDTETLQDAIAYLERYCKDGKPINPQAKHCGLFL